MKMPWAAKTGLAKTVVILATALLLSLGLCGANLGLFARFGQIEGGGVPGRPMWPTSVLITSGFVELAVMAGSAVGLLICAVVAVVKAIRDKQ